MRDRPKCWWCKDAINGPVHWQGGSSAFPAHEECEVVAGQPTGHTKMTHAGEVIMLAGTVVWLPFAIALLCFFVLSEWLYPEEH